MKALRKKVRVWVIHTIGRRETVIDGIIISSDAQNTAVRVRGFKPFTEPKTARNKGFDYGAFEKDFMLDDPNVLTEAQLDRVRVGRKFRADAPSKRAREVARLLQEELSQQ